MVGVVTGLIGWHELCLLEIFFGNPLTMARRFTILRGAVINRVRFGLNHHPATCSFDRVLFEGKCRVFLFPP